MYSNLHFYKFNNYYNRILKRHASLEDYNTYQIGDTLMNVNFIPNDGINTEQVIDDWNNDIPDYLIVEEDGEIVSRWFIIESVRMLTEQFKLTLYRDTLADYFDEIGSSTMFVEKGPLLNDDPFVFNSEDMTVNQIKKDETLLRDSSRTPWLVGYMSTSNVKKNDTVEPHKFKFKRKIEPDYTVTNLVAFSSITGLTSGRAEKLLDYSVLLKANWLPKAGDGKNVNQWLGILGFNRSGASKVNDRDVGVAFTEDGAPIHDGYKFNGDTFNATELAKAIGSSLPSNFESWTIPQYFGFNDTRYNTAIQFQDTIIYCTDEQKYYKVNVSTEHLVKTGTINNGSGLQYAVKTAVLEHKSQYGLLIENPNYTPPAETFGMRTDSISATVSFNEFDGVAVEEKEVSIPVGRNTLNDAPYCMFAIPLEKINIIDTEAVKYKTVNKDISLAYVASMSKALSGVGELMDIQLLPYCPLPKRLRGGNGRLDITGLQEGTDYQFVAVDGTTTGVFTLWLEESTFSLTLEQTITNPYKSEAWPNKEWNELNKYRLVSPNHSSAFEFSPAKNNGVISFNIDCTYKPFQPYIKVSPLFNGLYGADFDDARGLICSGDYSLPQLKDAWETYQRQNINYEKTFQRQIENMEVNNKYQKVNDITNAITGTISGGLSGAMTGSLVGGVPGLIAGAAVGTASAAAGGILDYKMKEALRDEAKDYATDLYNYNLGNIQALPTTISKVSAFTANNKLYPFIETYSCTPQEAQAFRNKLAYSGLTVMRIGTLNEFINYRNVSADNYFKGQLIRLDTISDDFHVVNTIAGELKKGVFI